MKKTIYFFSLRFLALLCVIITSCKADIDLNDVSPEIEFGGGIAIPVGIAKISLGDVLGDETFDSLLFVDKDSSYFLKYNASYTETLPHVGISDPVELMDENFDLPRDLLTLPTTLSTGDTRILTLDIDVESDLISDNIDAVFSATEDASTPGSRSTGRPDSNEPFQIKTVERLKVGSAEFSFSFEKNAELGLEYNDIDSIIVELDENVFFETKKRVQIPKTTGFDQEHTLDLSNFIARFYDESGNKIDEVNFTLKVYITAKGNRSIAAGANLNCMATAEEFDVNTLWGDCVLDELTKDYNINLRDELNISELSNKEWIIPFNNPQITLSTQTNIGVPIIVGINHLRAINTDNSTVDYKFNGSNTFSFPLENLPTSVNDTVVNTAPVFNKDFGDLDLVFEEFPEEIEISCYAKNLAKPEYDRFLATGSFINIDLEAKIPVVFNPAVIVEYTDTLKDLSIPDTLSTYGDVSVAAYIDVKNSLPFEFDAEIVFLDENNNELELELINPKATEPNKLTLPAAETDATGSVRKSGDVMLQVGLNTQDDIHKINKIVYKLRLGDNEGVAALKSGDSVTLQLSVTAVGDVNLEL